MKENWFDDQKALLKDVTAVVKQEAPEILAVMCFAFILGFREGWSLTSTLYFCIMSASTTGFLQPNSIKVIGSFFFHLQ
jgi:hypothetical protein